MFTGIIEELGVVKAIVRRGHGSLLTLAAEKILNDTKIGDSIAVNGACLTVVKVEQGALSFEVMPQTSTVTNLGTLRQGEKINLERSLKVGSRISGHFVLGHIDCLGVIRRKGYIRDNLSFEIAVSAHTMKFILPKGSIAVDGISLTIAEKKATGFTVCVIPHTLIHTTLGFKGPSDTVNIECDILAKRAAE